MDDELTLRIVLWLWGGILGGLLAGAIAGFVWRWIGPQSAAFGVGAGVFFVVLTIGAGGATGIAAAAALERRSGTVPTLGELLAVERQSQYDMSKKRTTTMQVPRVAFTTAEGRRLQFTGLGGSLAGREPGDVVKLRYRPEKPELALIDDFQHEWGAAWGMGAFAGFGLAGAIGCLRGLPGEIRTARVAEARMAQVIRRTGKRSAQSSSPPPPPPAPRPGPLARWRRSNGSRFGRPLVALGWLNMLLALLAVGAFSDNVARSIAIAFAGVVSGLVCLAFGYWLRGAAAGTKFPFALLGLAAAFAYFGFGAWMLSAG
jgi:hypothetical protein